MEDGMHGMAVAVAPSALCSDAPALRAALGFVFVCPSTVVAEQIARKAPPNRHLPLDGGSELIPTPS